MEIFIRLLCDREDYHMKSKIFLRKSSYLRGGLNLSVQKQHKQYQRNGKNCTVNTRVQINAIDHT